MSPGIVEADPEIKEGDLVIIVEKGHGKAIGIGKALVAGKDMVGEKARLLSPYTTWG